MRGIVCGVPLRRSGSRGVVTEGDGTGPLSRQGRPALESFVPRRCIVMSEYDGTLKQLCGAWARRKAAHGPPAQLDMLATWGYRACASLLGAMVRMLDVGLIYADLKASNVCLETDGVALCDLGGAFDAVSGTGYCTYPPPEFHRGVIRRPDESVLSYTAGVLMLSYFFGFESVESLSAGRTYPPARREGSEDPLTPTTPQREERRFEEHTVATVSSRCCGADAGTRAAR